MEEKRNSLTFQDFNQSVLKPSNEKDISEIVKSCFKKNIPLEIQGLGTKKKIGRNFQSEKTLDLSKNAGIIEYLPEELYIKVKSGTPIDLIKKELKKNNQELAFEPTDFGPLFCGSKNEGTIGGVVSCNFAGPRRFKVGSARDHILGFRGINGRGEIIKSGGTVVKNVTGYDLSKIASGSFGTLMVFSEISIKVLPISESNKTLVIDNNDLKSSLDYLNKSLSSSSDPSGAVFYPKIFRDQFTLNDLTVLGSITAIRLEGSINSIDQRLNKLIKDLKLEDKKLDILAPNQSEIFWDETRSLKVFSNLNKNLFRIVVPPSETFDLLNSLSKYNIKYFVDWGGNLVWMQVDDINPKELRELRNVVKKFNGYLTIIKVSDDLKGLIDIFTINEIKYQITEKIKKSFDPKRILNPGKMYIGI